MCTTSKFFARCQALRCAREWPCTASTSAATCSGGVNWLKTGALGAGIVLASAALDDRAFRYANDHRDSSALNKLVDYTDALPLAAVGLSGIFAFDESRAQLSDTGLAAVEGSALAFLAASGLKYAVGRARPDSGEGKSDFNPFESEEKWQSFPSRHTAVMWAAVTPYAKEFDMPWLYGVAALTNAARVGSREHWVSDTVAGSLLGYALGHIAWEARRDSRRGKAGPALAIGPGTVGVAWTLD